ncbi:MAG: M20/M25/M40 family metallo-hydrolase [Gemmatimonadetes bacterium]|nr:MAG: M20/M25/M40 family metallo-hydrolase [Gemmatimonadota bacterium]
MFRRLVQLVLLALVVVAGVVLYRTASLSSLQPPVPAAFDDPTPLDAEAAVERFAGAIRFPTVSREDAPHDSAAFRALHAYLAEVFPRVHATLERETIGGLSLLYRWPGRDPSKAPIVLMGHQDVVPVIPGTEDDWTHGPFSGAVAEGFVWGRGTLDDKVSVLAILEAVETLLEAGHTPERTVYLAFGHDEEIGGRAGARVIADTLEARGVSEFAFVLDEGGAILDGETSPLDRPMATVGIAEKGGVNLQLVVRSAGGHSSTPPPHTAIGVLARAIVRLEENPFPASLEGPGGEMLAFMAPEMGFGARMAIANRWLFGRLLTRAMLGDPATAAMLRTTTAATIIDGGVKSNVLPIEARAVVNFRIRPGETPASVAERVRAVIDDPAVEVSGEQNGRPPSPVSDPHSDAFRTIASTIREVAGEEVVVAPYLVVGGTDARYYAPRSRNVYRFLPVRLEPDGLQRLHGTNERVAVSGYLDSVRFFQTLLRKVDALP